MQISSTSFVNGGHLPGRCAFAVIHPDTRFTFSENRSPQLSWKGIPAAAKSLILLCVDPDAPTRPDDVNQEGRVVPADLPRTDFSHWVMVDIPIGVTSIDEGAYSSAVTPGGKRDPDGPAGARQGINDYSSWFAGDDQLDGTYRGYDGPAPPWNDARVHRYDFEIIATNLERCPVDGDFSLADVRAAIDGHVLARARMTGLYTLNPDLAPGAT